MDYGYQLLRHVVQQVLGNIRQAARLTLTLFLAPLIGLFALSGGSIGGALAEGPGGLGIIGALALLVLAVVAYCWAAVGWHRYVLLHEIADGIVPAWRGDRVRAYIGRGFVVGVVVVLAVLAGTIIVGIMAAVTQSLNVAVALGIGLVFGASWVATRVGLVLPAAALGTRMTIAESWAVTRPVASHILLPLIVIALVVGVIQQLMVVIFGTSIPTDAFGVPQERIVLSLPGQILSAGVSWVQILLNLALMTTLYGNLVEGRQLN